MKVVGLDNVIAGCDNIELSYNHECRDFDFLIGKVLRDRNMLKIGKVIAIDYYRDGYQHDHAFAVTDTGKRFNCRKLGLK